MNDNEIDHILGEAAGEPPAVDGALVDRIAGSIGSSLRPVRPLAPEWFLVLGLLVVCAAIAVAIASMAGLYGIRALGALRIAVIFPLLGILAWSAAKVSVAEMAPGSRHWIAPSRLLLFGTLALVAAFALLFHDYRVDGFVHQGWACLELGMMTAFPTGFLAWLILRRGFAVNPLSADLAAGMLAAMAGVIMLELHCPNFRTMHILVWHTAVIPVSAAAATIDALVRKR